MTVTEIKIEFERAANSELTTDIVSDTEIIVYLPFGPSSIRVVLVEDKQHVQFCYADDGDWYDPLSGEFEQHCTCSFRTAADLVDRFKHDLE